jgi:hypothetical protein
VRLGLADKELCERGKSVLDRIVAMLIRLSASLV